MKKLTTLILTAILAAGNLFAQNYEEKAIELIKTGQYEECYSLLQEWSLAEPDNIEINIYYFNYYIERNTKHYPMIGPLGDGRYGMYEKVVYDLNDVDTAVSYFDKILNVEPRRIDVMSSKCTAYIYSEQFDKASDILVDIIKYSKQIDNNWLWSGNKTLKQSGFPEGEDFLFEVVNECFQEILFPFEENQEYTKKIIEAELEYYPDNTWGLNHAATYYRYLGDNQNALKILKRAVELDPEDYVLVGNLAYFYELNQEYLNAKQWYEYMLTMDDPRAVQYGLEGLQYIDGKY